MAWLETATNPWNGQEEQCYTRLAALRVIDTDETISAEWIRYASKEAYDNMKAGKIQRLVADPGGQLVIRREAGAITVQKQTADGVLTSQIPMPSYSQLRAATKLAIVDGVIALKLPGGTTLALEVDDKGEIDLFDVITAALYKLSEPMFPGAEKV